MNNEFSTHIRKLIAQAKKHESIHHAMRNYIRAMQPRLHHTIQLPESNPASALHLFVIAYIENVPEFLDTLCKTLDDAHIYQDGEAIVSIIADFFINQPEESVNSDGLMGLLSAAYLAHRLLEELNDRLIMICGVALSPMEMTLSNIIVLELLGDEFANKLDLAIHYAIESLFKAQPNNTKSPLSHFVELYSQTRECKNRDWPCLAEESAISLKYGREEHA